MAGIIGLLRVTVSAAMSQCAPSISGAKDDEAMKEATAVPKPEWLTNPQTGFIVGESGCVTGLDEYNIEAAKMDAQMSAVELKCIQQFAKIGHKVTGSVRGTVFGQVNTFSETCVENGKTGIRVYLRYLTENVMCVPPRNR